jgi:hypothetical protein
MPCWFNNNWGFLAPKNQSQSKRLFSRERSSTGSNDCFVVVVVVVVVFYPLVI